MTTRKRLEVDKAMNDKALSKALLSRTSTPVCTRYNKGDEVLALGSDETWRTVVIVEGPYMYPFDGLMAAREAAYTVSIGGTLKIARADDLKPAPEKSSPLVEFNPDFEYVILQRKSSQGVGTEVILAMTDRREFVVWTLRDGLLSSGRYFDSSLPKALRCFEEAI